MTARQYTNFIPVSAKQANANGKYTLNVIPGDYRIVAKNRTRFDYASETYDGSTTGTSNNALGAKVILTAGDTTTLDFALDKGYKISGQVLDNVGGNPVKGERVSVGPIRMRTNKLGKYRVWLKPATYNLQSYGTTYSGIDMNLSNQTRDIAVQVAKVTLTIQDSSGNPITQAKVRLTDLNGKGITNDISKGDGTVSLYSPNNASDNKIVVTINDSHTYASSVWTNVTRLLSGTNVITTIGSTNALGTMTLPVAGYLRVVVTSDGTTPVASYGVSILSGGTAGTDQFVRGGTLTDGKVEFSVPAATYDAVIMRSDAYNCLNVPVTANQTTVVTYTTGGTCSIATNQ